uniref:Uncharacterized protein n=1 Tax=Tanacetum cinerariifolium TaxID=118510 RepID=A0A6L2P8V6_TANCI|nr:hypothetical protein [Tanacetum cinerariifolium]
MATTAALQIDLDNAFVAPEKQEFDEPPSEEEILSFIKELCHTGKIKNITAVVVDHMHQPELYGDVNIRLTNVEPDEEDKGYKEMTNAETVDAEHENVIQESVGNKVKDDAQATQKTRVPLHSSSILSDYAAKYLNFDNISPIDTEFVSMLDICVQREVPRTSPLLTNLVFVIPEHNVINPPETVTTASATTISSFLTSLFPHLQKSTPIPSPTTTKATTSTIVVPNSETLTTLHQRISDLEKDVKELKDRQKTSKGNETSKKTSATKDSSKGKTSATSSKSSKSGKSAKDQVVEPISMQDSDNAEYDDADYADMSMDQGEDLGKTNKQPNNEAIHKNDWYKKSKSDPSPDPEWNKGKLIDDGPEQSWLNDMAKDTKPPLTFDELMHTPIKFSAFRCPYDLTKPLPVKMSSQGRQIVPANFFFNKDLEYLRGGSNDKKYTASTTKSKAARYELKGIKDMVPNLWSPVKQDIYSTKRILNIVSVKVNEWYEYGYLKEFVVKRADKKLYTFKEGDFKRLRLNDIKDMLLLIV